MSEFLDILCRVFLISFITWLIYYREICFGVACKVTRQSSQAYIRFWAVFIGILGFVAPVAGVLMSMVLFAYIMDSQYGTKTKKEIAIAAVGSPASNETSRENRKGEWKPGGKGKPPQGIST